MPWDQRVGRRLKLRELNIFLAVAHAGSMAKAAKGLAISQPAVSKAIADMEHSLGVPSSTAAHKESNPRDMVVHFLNAGSPSSTS